VVADFYQRSEVKAFKLKSPNFSLDGAYTVLLKNKLYAIKMSSNRTFKIARYAHPADPERIKKEVLPEL